MADHDTISLRYRITSNNQTFSVAIDKHSTFADLEKKIKSEHSDISTERIVFRKENQHEATAEFILIKSQLSEIISKIKSKFAGIEAEQSEKVVEPSIDLNSQICEIFPETSNITNTLLVYIIEDHRKLTIESRSNLFFINY